MQKLEKSSSERSESKYEALILEEPLFQKTYHHYCKLINVVIHISYSSLYLGYSLTVLSTFMPNIFSTVYGIEAEESSWQGILIGALAVGAILGAGIAPFFMKTFTRKQSVLLLNVLALIIQGILQIGNIYILLVCRIFQGILSGLFMAVLPLYVSEMVPKQLLNKLRIFPQMMVVFGMAKGYVVGLVLGFFQADSTVFFRVIFSFNTVFIIVQTILLLTGFIPESPNSFIRLNRNEEAKEVIKMFTVQSFVEKTFKQKQIEVENQNKQQQSSQALQSSSKLISSKTNYILAIELSFMHQLTGIYAIITQVDFILAELLPLPYMSFIGGVSSVFLQWIATLFAICFLHKFQRKSIIIFGNLSLGILDILFGLLFIYDQFASNGYVVYGFVLLYNVIYGLTLGPVIWLYVPEIIPPNVVPLASMINWFGCSLCLIFTPIAMNANMGNPWPIFMFFGGVTLFLFIFNAVFLKGTPEKRVKKIVRQIEAE